MSTNQPSREADMDVQCRSCPERAPDLTTVRDGADWMDGHSREAHGKPHLGARWTRVREGEDREQARSRAWGRSR